MYVKIKENKLLSWCEKPYLDYEYVDIDCSTFDANKYEVQEGKLVDISSTDEYKAKVQQQANAIKKVQLQSEIEALDIKSIRALREGGVKDETSGQTWIQYYTSEIARLRTEISNL